MAYIGKVAKVRTTYRCSSSIANFREKLDKRLGLPVWHWWRNRNDKVIFFGLYHYKDYIRFIWHRGQKKVFWCGSDILALEKHPVWAYLIKLEIATHYCENKVEQDKLWGIGIIAEIRPMFFDDPAKYTISYQWAKNPRVFATYHKGREQEYGYRNNPNIDFLDGLPEDEFNEKIKEYQGAIRFNEFDGFAESLAKSVLMGQYPISKIKYPFIWELDDGASYQFPKEPNYIGREYWLKQFEDNLKEIIS